MATSHLFTSESVTEGHPDKVCDQVSDAILDAALARDTASRVACETLTTRGLTFVAGEITTDCYIDIPGIVRSIIEEVGYTNPHYGYHWEASAVVTAIQQQSADIAMGVDSGGAGDQGMMFGYACDETPELMPLPIMLAHRLVRAMADARRAAILPYLRPDGKSQVTVRYENGRPACVESVVMAAQHDEGVETARIREDLIRLVMDPVVPESLRGDLLRKDPERAIHVNPTGRFVLGGPQADTGVTGRKIIVDTYGGAARHGGGCFSGKDPTKVDRSAAYMMRYLAKNIVAAGLARACEIQVAYVIGERQPVSVMVDTRGTGVIPDERISRLIRKHFDLSPGGIITALDLLKPIYRRTACYGHFGRTEPTFTWERTDAAELFKKEAGA